MLSGLWDCCPNISLLMCRIKNVNISFPVDCFKENFDGIFYNQGFREKVDLFLMESSN